MPKLIDNYKKLFDTFGTTWELNGSAEAVADECPFCGEARHCYLNVKSGLYDCKKCGKHGNHLTFIRHEYAKALDATTDADYRQLKNLRGLPLQTLKRRGLAWHSGRKRWLIPFKSAKGGVLNLVRYAPDTGEKYNLPSLSSYLYGVEQLSGDAARLLFLCEGPWDAIALDQHFVDTKTRKRYDILAVPGAGNFSKQWARHFKGRKLRIVFDNDNAGRKGQDRIAKILGKIATEIRALKWPDDYPKGCDIDDLIKDGVNIAEFTRDHCLKVAAGEHRLLFVRGDDVKSEPTEWLWDGHIPFGTFVSFSGDHGTLKSTLARDWAARATKGKPMPHCTEALPPFDVIYFTSEDKASTVKDLVALADGDVTRLHIFDLAASAEHVDLLDYREEIEAKINSLKARLVIIDALNSFVGGDSSSDAKARKTLTSRLQSMAQRTGACIIGIRNWGRADGGTASQKALGAVSLSHVARCAINTKELPPIEEGAPRNFQLEFEKVSDAPRPEPVSYGVNDKSKGDKTASHLRRIVWHFTAEEIERAFPTKKVAQNGSNKGRPRP